MSKTKIYAAKPTTLTTTKSPPSRSLLSSKPAQRVVQRQPVQTAMKFSERVGGGHLSTCVEQRANASLAPTTRQMLPAANSVAIPIQCVANTASGASPTASVATSHPDGLPPQLKAGIEELSGYSMDAVRVHYNSSQPARLHAHAFAQGTDIHLAPGQERHLPHEAWHVVQQAQGRVQPTMQLKGVAINDESVLEREAEAIGKSESMPPAAIRSRPTPIGLTSAVAQRVINYMKKDYYKGDVSKPGSPIAKDLKNEPDSAGLLAVAEELAALDEEFTFSNKKAFVAFLRERGSKTIDDITNNENEKEEKTSELLTKLGDTQGQPKGWGHTFSNGKHGPDMARDNGKLAKQRATDEKTAVGVWVSRDLAEKLICTAFARIAGEDGAYFVRCGELPQHIGVEYVASGEPQTCDGFFLKIKDGIVITSYPAQQSAVKGDVIVIECNEMSGAE